MKNRGFIDAFWLKLIMAMLMTLDHLYYYGIIPQRYILVHYLARLVAPVFAFLMAQGMIHTRNRPRYILRMAGCGGIMLAGNYCLYMLTGQWVPMNIFLSLAIGAALIYCIDRFRSEETPALWILVGAALVFLCQYCEGGHLVPLMAVIFYYFRKQTLLMSAVYAAATGIPYLIPYLQGSRLNPQFFMIFAVFPILAYNGKRGYDGPFGKYFFYVFYPLHIWVIFLAAQFAT